MTKRARTVTNISKLPTHSVSNIRNQHRCNRFNLPSLVLSQLETISFGGGEFLSNLFLNRFPNNDLVSFTSLPARPVGV